MFRVLTYMLCCHILAISAQTWLRADSDKDAYKLIDDVFGGSAVEVPDCKHKVKHITMANDSDLKRAVFLFHIHVNKDDDTCTNFDRQRTEIKISNPSPDKLKGFKDETVHLTWNFKLDAAFQASESFSHIHQLKDVGGASGTPILTISPRKANPDVLQIIHVDSRGKKTVIADAPLAPFKGSWVHVEEKVRYASNGSYNVKITKINGGSTLLTVDKNNLDMWRTGAEYVRPKWGIYRSLDRKNQLRDEIVRFDSFCLDKGSKNRCT